MDGEVIVKSADAHKPCTEHDNKVEISSTKARLLFRTNQNALQ